MRCAQYIYTLSGHALANIIAYVEKDVAMSLSDMGYAAEEGSVYPIGDIKSHEAWELLKTTLFAKPTKTGMVEVFTTALIGPHTDAVVGDYTAGLVLQGDHYLFTGNGRRVCDLTPGVVYLLNNKRQHGAFKNRPDAPPLVFVAADFFAESMVDAMRRVC